MVMEYSDNVCVDYNIVFSASRIKPESVISSVSNSSLPVSPSESLSSSSLLFPDC